MEIPIRPEHEKLVVIRGSFNATDALCVVASLTGDVEAHVASDIIYPYYCYDVECSVPTLAGRKNVSMICLVDAANGLGATADSFELKKETIPVSRILATDIDADTATRIATRTVTHRMGKELRTIADFDVEMKPRGLVHKRFWIVQTSEARLLVDSTTAGWFPLKLEAA
jgi:hypothetical protein